MGFLKNLVKGLVEYAAEEAERKRQLEEEKSNHDNVPRRPIPPPIDTPRLYDKNDSVISPDFRVGSID